LPRKARKKSSSGIYHIIMRGINQQIIFEDDEDKRKYLGILKRCKEISGFELYSYCLMDNHIHLLVKETDEPISKVIMRISSSYVYWYNLKYGRCGHLFQERYKSENVEDTRYFLTVLRYIHQNPLKAGLAKSVWDSKWTSVHEYVQRASMVDIDKGLNLFSRDRKSAIKGFGIFMQQKNEDHCLEYIVRMADSQVREYLFTLGITSNSMLQQMDREHRNKILAKLKKLEGVSIRQIARITGISKSVISDIR
jgi:putative transposase